MRFFTITGFLITTARVHAISTPRSQAPACASSCEKVALGTSSCSSLGDPECWCNSPSFFSAYIACIGEQCYQSNLVSAAEEAYLQACVNYVDEPVDTNVPPDPTATTSTRAPAAVNTSGPDPVTYPIPKPINTSDVGQGEPNHAQAAVQVSGMNGVLVGVGAFVGAAVALLSTASLFRSDRTGVYRNEQEDGWRR